jgi:hypothetical protein
MQRPVKTGTAAYRLRYAVGFPALPCTAFAGPRPWGPTVAHIAGGPRAGPTRPAPLASDSRHSSIGGLSVSHPSRVGIGTHSDDKFVARTTVATP